MHECADAVLPCLVAIPMDLELRDHKKEVSHLFFPEYHTNTLYECLYKLEYVFIFFLKPCGQQIAHVNHDALLWRQIVLECCLTATSALNFGSQAKSVKFEQLEHPVCLSDWLILGLLALEKARFQAMAKNQSHCAKTCTLDSLTASDKVFTKHWTRKCNIPQNLPVHEVRGVTLIACEIQDNLTCGLDISYDSLVALDRLLSSGWNLGHFWILEQMLHQSVDVVAKFVQSTRCVQNLNCQIACCLHFFISTRIDETTDSCGCITADLSGHHLESRRQEVQKGKLPGCLGCRRNSRLLLGRGESLLDLKLDWFRQNWLFLDIFVPQHETDAFNGLLLRFFLFGVHQIREQQLGC